MGSMVKNVLIYLTSSVIVLVILDIIFQQSKIISGLHIKVDENGTFFRPDFHMFSFNEGFGIQYTDSNGVMIYNPDKSESWNIYGDSFIEALQVFQRHHFAESLAKSKDVSIVNFGQSSMNFESMFSTYFYAKEKFPAQKHILFISSDDFDTDEIAHIFPLPEFNDTNILIRNSSFVYQETIQRKVERNFHNSSTLMLAKSDLRQVKNGLLPSILFDKFYIESKEEIETEDLVKPKRVIQLLNVLKNEPNVVLIYRGQEPMTKRYQQFFADAKIPVFDLEMAMAKKSNSSYFYHQATNTYGHWNRKAHEIISEILNHEL